MIISTCHFLAQRLMLAITKVSLVQTCVKYQPFNWLEWTVACWASTRNTRRALSLLRSCRISCVLVLWLNGSVRFLRLASDREQGQTAEENEGRDRKCDSHVALLYEWSEQ